MQGVLRVTECCAQAAVEDVVSWIEEWMDFGVARQSAAFDRFLRLRQRRQHLETRPRSKWPHRSPTKAALSVSLPQPRCAHPRIGSSTPQPL